MPRSPTALWVDRLIPPALVAKGGVELRRARLSVVVAGSLCIAALIATAMRVGVAPPAIVAIMFFAALVALFVPLVMRWTGSARVAAQLLTGLSFIGVTGANLSTGGQVIGFLLASMLVPLVALLLLPLRAGLIWGALAVLQAGLAPGLVSLGLGPLVSSPAPARELLLLVGPPTSTALALAIAVAFRRYEAADVAALNRARVEAEKASMAKSRFLATMSHELRTPMNGVVGALSLLRADNLSEAAQGHVEIAAQSAETLLALIGNVLDLAAIEAGVLTLDSRAFHLGDEVRGTVEALRGLAEGKSLTLELELAPEVDTSIIGDRRRVRQLITNLLGNAVKYTLEGRVLVRVREHPAGRLEIAVVDTGPGIPESMRAGLFESFVRGSHSLQGTGLGLAIVREVVARMEGTISVDSELGRGSTFSLDMPLTRAKAQTHAASAVATEGRKLDVLVVEDNPINQIVVSALLERLGHSVSIASDGRAGVERWQAGRFDCVLMDREMPTLDGIGATEEIRAYERQHQVERRTPIIALTASVLADDQEACLAAGMDDYLAKPIDVQALSAVLERFGGRT